jgi:hypothetical protein
MMGRHACETHSCPVGQSPAPLHCTQVCCATSQTKPAARQSPSTLQGAPVLGPELPHATMKNANHAIDRMDTMPVCSRPPRCP